MTSTAARIVITVAKASIHPEPELAERRNALYTAAISRAGGEAVLIDIGATAAERTAAFATMDGLLLSGGVDIEPARYGQPNRGSVEIQQARDGLEAEAWAVANQRHLPILGICRGLQAINVFSGGRLLQDVGAHAGPGWGKGPAATHPLRLAPGSRLARILVPTNAHGGVLTVNSYHHQGVRAADLASGLVAGAWASSPSGDLVEGLEAADGRFIIGVQCHPERTESTPAAFERLFAVFVAAARGPAGQRR